MASSSCTWWNHSSSVVTGNGDEMFTARPPVRSLCAWNTHHSDEPHTTCCAALLADGTLVTNTRQEHVDDSASEAYTPVSASSIASFVPSGRVRACCAVNVTTDNSSSSSSSSSTCKGLLVSSTSGKVAWISFKTNSTHPTLQLLDSNHPFTSAAAFSASMDGSVVACALTNGDVALVDTASRSEVARLSHAKESPPPSSPRCVAISTIRADARILASTYTNNSVRIFDASDGVRVLRGIIVTPSTPTSIALLPPPSTMAESAADAIQVAVGSADGALFEWPWDIRLNKISDDPPIVVGSASTYADGACESLCYGSSAEGIVLAGTDGGVRVYRVRESATTLCNDPAMPMHSLDALPWHANCIAKLTVGSPITTMLVREQSNVAGCWTATIGMADGRVAVWRPAADAAQQDKSNHALASACFAESALVMESVARERMRLGAGGALAPAARARLWHGARTDDGSLAAIDAAARVDAWIEAEEDALNFVHAPQQVAVEHGSTCMLCLMEHASGAGSALPCGHIMHKDCLTAWVRDVARQGLWRCPMCRADVAVVAQNDLPTTVYMI